MMNLFKQIKQTEEKLASNKNNTELLNEYGVLLAKAQLYQQSLTVFLSIVSEYELESPEIFNNIANCYLRLNDIDKAMQYYHQSLRLDVNNYDTLNNLANLYYKLGNLPESKNYYEKSIRINPNNWVSHYNYGNLLVRLNQFHQAINHFEIAKEFSTNNTLLSNLGFCYYQVGDLKNAVAIFNSELLNIESFSIDMLYTIGCCFLDYGDLVSAKTYFDKVIALDTTHAEAHHNLAIISLGEKKYDSALEHFKHNVNNSTSIHMISALEGKIDATNDIDDLNYARDLFEQYASYYDEHMTKQLQYNLPETLRSKYSKLYQQKLIDFKYPKLLDIGCGTGLCGKYFRDVSHESWGIDISHSMLIKAYLSNFYDFLLEADINNLSVLPDNYFNIVLAADSLVYIKNIKKVIQDLARVMKTSGIFMFSIEKGLQGDVSIDISGRYQHGDMYTKNCLIENGFKIISTHELKYRFGSDNFIGSVYITKKT